MRNNRKKICITAIAVLAMLVALVCCMVGCNTNVQREYITSYVSTDSVVYSTTAEVVSKVADTVVEISTESTQTQWGMQYIVSGAGSGVIVGKSETGYYIITNNHVIEGAENIVVRTRAGVEYTATLVATDDSQDIGIVSIQTQDELKLATWGNSDDLQVGEDLIAIGNPMGSLGGTVTKGILSATGRTIVVGDFAMTLLQTDTAINPGNSGGGLFNMRGELIGVVNAKTSDEEIEGICFAIPANTAKDVYNKLLEYGYLPGRVTLQIKLEEGTVNNGQTMVYVAEVGDVAVNTFKQYDRIYKVNDIEITSVAQFNIVLSSIKPGDSVTLQVYRCSRIFGNQISFDTQVTEFSVTALQYVA